MMDEALVLVILVPTLFISGVCALVIGEADDRRLWTVAGILLLAASALLAFRLERVWL
jgi:hypothetical protein